MDNVHRPVEGIRNRSLFLTHPSDITKGTVSTRLIGDGRRFKKGFAKGPQVGRGSGNRHEAAAPAKGCKSFPNPGKAAEAEIRSVLSNYLT